MTVVYKIDSFIEDARKAGVTDAALKPLTGVTDRINELEELDDAAADGALTVTDMLFADATVAECVDTLVDTVARRTMLGNLMSDVFHMQDAIAQRYITNEETLDQLLTDLAATLKPAHAALTKVVERWGDENPDPGQVAATATAAELKEYRARTKHIAARDQVYKVANALIVSERKTEVTPFAAFIYPDTMQPKPNAAWLFNDDGTARTTKDIRRMLNARATLHEINNHNRYAATRSEFVPLNATYAVHPDKLNTAVFDNHSRPAAEDLLTMQDYTDLYNDNTAWQEYLTRVSQRTA